MRVLVAGATGLIGQALLPLLRARGHHVTALVRVPPGPLWSTPPDQIVVADAMDPAATRAAVLAAAPEVVVHQMTALRTPAGERPEEALARTAALRTKGTANLLDAARTAGARRIVAQSIAFATEPPAEPDAGTAALDEDAPLYRDAPDESWATSVRAVAELERLVLGDPALPGVVLRYGMLFGSGTRYDPTGLVAASLRAGRMPIPGTGGGVTSFVSVADAAVATVPAVEGADTGMFNIVDDEPAPANVWLPEYARQLGGPAPRVVPPELAQRLLGWFTTYQLTRLAGASNERARTRLGWRPTVSWRTGLAAAGNAAPVADSDVAR